MPALAEVLLILFSLLLASVWSATPDLRPYQLHASALIFLVYWIIHFLTKKTWWHWLPRQRSFDTAILTAALTLLILYTGGVLSPFSPLLLLLLFVSALTLNTATVLTLTVGLTVVLWMGSPHPFLLDGWIRLLVVPATLPLVLMARWQWEVAQQATASARSTRQVLSAQETNALLFLSTFLIPKLQLLQSALVAPTHNHELVQKQLLLMEHEAQELIQTLDEASDEV